MTLAFSVWLNRPQNCFFMSLTETQDVVDGPWAWPCGTFLLSCSPYFTLSCIWVMGVLDPITKLEIPLVQGLKESIIFVFSSDPSVIPLLSLHWSPSLLKCKPVHFTAVLEIQQLDPVAIFSEAGCWCCALICNRLPRFCCGKESACQGRRRYRRRGFDPWVGKILRSGKWQPTVVFSPGKSHGQGSLVGLWGCKESGMTEHADVGIGMDTHWALSGVCKKQPLPRISNNASEVGQTQIAVWHGPWGGELFFLFGWRGKQNCRAIPCLALVLQSFADTA